jgi:GNAT superfamily N-acetyltransferase
MDRDAYSEAHESAGQLAGAWAAIVENYGSGDIIDLPGFATRWSNSKFPFFNTIINTGMSDREELDQRLQASARYMKGRSNPGFFWLFEDLLSDEAKEGLPDALGKAGLVPSLPLTGMAAELTGRDLTPEPSPELSFIRVETEEHVRAYSDINCMAYAMPLETGRDGFGMPELWTRKAFAYLGIVDGIPVSAAATIAVDGRLFLALIAALPDMQKRGYGKATVLKALQEGSRATGLTRSILQATDAGRPLYERIGYYKTATITCLALGEQE